MEAEVLVGPVEVDRVVDLVRGLALAAAGLEAAMGPELEIAATAQAVVMGRVVVATVKLEGNRAVFRADKDLFGATDRDLELALAGTRWSARLPRRARDRAEGPRESRAGQGGIRERRIRSQRLGRELVARILRDFILRRDPPGYPGAADLSMAPRSQSV